MGLIFNSFWTEIWIVIFIFLTIFYINHRYMFWKNAGIPQLDGTFLFDSVEPLLTNKTSFGIKTKIIYDDMKSKGWSYGGFYVGLKEHLMIINPDLIKCILFQNADHFNSRGQNSFDHDPLTKHLFALSEQEWRDLRLKLNPAFTCVKIKLMCPNVLACSTKLERRIDEAVFESGIVEIKSLSEQFTMDVITSCAFGLDSNGLSSFDTELEQIGKLIFHPTLLDNFKRRLSYSIPEVLSFFEIPLVNRKVSNFFIKMSEDAIRYREDNKVQRKDFLQLLIELKNNNMDGDSITLKEIAAQSYLFMLAGFETSSSTITFCLYELSKNLEIQKKLREEILKILEKNGGKITYDALMEMGYMNKVILETLRKYPPLAFLKRQCTKDYIIPNTDISLKKGSSILISTLGLHRDPEYYPDPEVFHPERFCEEKRAKRYPYTYLPFGEGPRNCIGMKFGLMQTKIGLTVLLKKFKFTLHDRTKVPLDMTTKSLTLSPLGGMWVNVTHIDK